MAIPPAKHYLALLLLWFLPLAYAHASATTSEPRPSGSGPRKPSQIVSTPSAEPGIPDQSKLLDAMRQYADQYISNLPNFICTQITRQFEAERRPSHWRKGDTLTSRLVFTQRREQRSLELVNNKPIKAGRRRWRAPLTTEGEFGILLANVLGTGSEASFDWNGWDTVRGKRVAVFDYSMDKEHSTLQLSLSDLVQGIVAYHGSVYADESTGAVRRITNSASDIPDELQTKAISTTIDYDDVAIAGANYLLPVHATVLMTLETGTVRNEIEFTGYRKFEADSVITYGPERDPAATQARNPKDRP